MFQDPPPEIAFYVLLWCTPFEILKMEESSSTFANLVREHDKQLWEIHLKRNWPIVGKLMASLDVASNRLFYKAFSTRCELEWGTGYHLQFSPTELCNKHPEFTASDFEAINKKLLYIVSVDNYFCGVAKWGTNADGFGSSHLCWSPPQGECNLHANAVAIATAEVENMESSIYVFDTDSMKCVTLIDGYLATDIQEAEKDLVTHALNANLTERQMKHDLIAYYPRGAYMFGYESGKEYIQDLNTVTHQMDYNPNNRHLPDEITSFSVRPGLRFRMNPPNTVGHPSKLPSFYLHEMSVVGMWGPDMSDSIINVTSPLMAEQGLLALIDQSTNFSDDFFTSDIPEGYVRDP